MERKLKFYLVAVYTANQRNKEGQSMAYNHRSDLLVAADSGGKVRITKAFCLGDDSGGQQVRPLEELRSFQNIEDILNILNVRDYSDDPAWRRVAETLSLEGVLRCALQAKRRGVATALFDWLRSHSYLNDEKGRTIWV